MIELAEQTTHTHTNRVSHVSLKKRGAVWLIRGTWVMRWCGVVSFLQHDIDDRVKCFVVVLNKIVHIKLQLEAIFLECVMSLWWSVSTRCECPFNRKSTQESLIFPP